MFEPRHYSVTSRDSTIALKQLAKHIVEVPSDWTVIVGEHQVLIQRLMTCLDNVDDFAHYDRLRPDLGKYEHPKQQVTLVERLKAESTERVLASTQCPLVLASCEQHEVWILERSGDTFSVRQGSVHPMLCTGSELNRVFFGVNHANDLSEVMRRYVEIAYKRRRSDEEQTEMEANLAKLQKHNISLDHIVPVERVP